MRWSLCPQSGTIGGLSCVFLISTLFSYTLTFAPNFFSSSAITFARSLSFTLNRLVFMNFPPFLYAAYAKSIGARSGQSLRSISAFSPSSESNATLKNLSPCTLFSLSPETLIVPTRRESAIKNAAFDQSPSTVNSPGESRPFPLISKKFFSGSAMSAPKSFKTFIVIST